MERAQPVNRTDKTKEQIKVVEFQPTTFIC
jgi:hypothetical protein